MERTRRWLLCILFAVSWPSTKGDIEENIPHQTLSCHNDFQTRIICHWEEMANAQRYLNLSLYYQMFKTVEAKQAPCDHSQNTSLPTCKFESCIPKTCFIHQKYMVGSQIDLFSFRTDRPLEIKLNVSLGQSVQPPTPKNLQITKNGTKGFLLSWEILQSWNQNHQASSGVLMFEVAYKRQWESWEEAFTKSSSTSHVTFGHDHLIPDNRYVARVRAKTSGERSSPWSSEVSWESQEGDPAQPKNLQCFFDGLEQLTCTWEVRAEVTGSVSFGLIYKAGPDETRECTPVHKERKPGSPYVQYRCQILVQDPNDQRQYTVTVQVKEEKKQIRSYLHVQPQPPYITVKKTGDSYWLNWKTVHTIYEQIYEVQYRKSTESWEDVHNETLRIVLGMEISEKNLEPATDYFARVRAKISSESYRGIWSEWSNEYKWTTDSRSGLQVPGPWILSLVLVVTTVLVLLGAWCCCNFGVRLKANWENKIPNPSKSHLFQNKNKRIWIPGNFSTSSQESPWEKEERESCVSWSNWNDLEDTSRSWISPLTAMDPQDACSLSSDQDSYPASINFPDENLSLFSSQKKHELNSPTKDLASGIAFNGPYLHLPHSHSLPNITDQMGSCQAEENKKQPHGSLEYFCLPQGGQGGLIPMAKPAELGKDREEISSVVPSDKEEPESYPFKDQAAPPSVEPRQEEHLNQPSTSSKDPLKLVHVTGYIAPEDLILGSGKPESPPPLSMPPLPCSALESSVSPSIEKTKGPTSAPSSANLALESYVEVPPKMTSTEVLPEDPSSLQVEPSTTNLMDSQQDETITMLHPDGLIVLQQIGDYCFFPSQGQLVSPGHCPEKMTKPQDIQGKEPPNQPMPQVPAIQLFKAMKHQDYLALPTWDGCRPGQVF
ncbi:cytokine receptor common subunit beta isoform X2 [Monodelphis domestica]|uniref:Colony stimulating factor 2 receptor beta common subunit n=1 Tax=Monodelphis domestica TaxID=13616 RepID=F6VPW1_MONDO|nr:cytokine receptor common subunit beta isoform X2 [Monodelphis domestica]XP_056654867.1 cytokine receptor common subunit beta isoform X2 [Monodelphis domestica]